MLSRISTDSYLYYTIQKVADSLISKKNRDRITRQHRLDIADRLEPIVKNRLPDLTNIRHNGFRIASEAHIARLRHSLDSVWSGLVAEARAIPNIADRAYVLSIIAAIHTTKEGARRDEILKEAVLLIESIPADVDRIERLVGIAELVVDVDILLTKKCLRSAIEGSLTRLEDDSLQESHRRAIDLAHHIDPSYAASLASLADTDPARAAMRSNLRQRLDLLETKQDMAGQGGSLKAQEDPENYSRAAWMNLGSLNAKRIQPVHADALLPYLDVAAKLPLHDAYPILAWMVQNNVVRLPRSDQARALLVPTFEATVLAAELGARLAARSSVHVRSTTSLVRTATANQTQIVVTPGEREAALQFIAEWLHGVADYLKICDPFFGPEDLEVLKIVAAANPDCRVSILTSRKRQDSVAQPWEESYRTHWRLHVSDIDPPDTDIVIAGREVGGDSPIHDRWWITNGAGLRLGTSFGSLGRGKSSEIAALTSVEADMREKEIDQYLVRKRREQDGVKLRYVSFTL